ncbi:MAG: alkaline phosphatase [Calditrichaeota bacterium]|nr:alkaline phosphatase [Calditrichota bacterium]
MLRKMSTPILTGIFACGLLAGACQSGKTLHSAPAPLASPDALATPSTQPRVKNVIFMIGDGMGITQMTAGRLREFGPNSKSRIESMPVTGLAHTHSIDDLITDSAASATALATGYKTRNGMIGMLPDMTSAKTLLEAAAEAGKKTGVVATSSVTHATPASFTAHVALRKMEPQIAEQQASGNVDVILGAGLQFFQPMSTEGSDRRDNRDLLAEARENGFQVVRSADEMAAITDGRILGLFAPKYLSGLAGEPSLTEMTNKAISLVKDDPDGFFLMIEGSQIDWGGHDNDPEYVIREMIAFDKAVQAALDFAEADGQTLVVVTADHETGGMSITKGSFGGDSLEVKWTTGKHTGTPVGVFAYGPGSLRFTGVFDNTELPRIIDDLWQLPDFPQVLSE